MVMRKEKFLLIFKKNIRINTMAEFRENFDFRKVMAYYQSKKLAVWLEDRLYSDEAEAIKAIKPGDKYAPQKICEILGIDYDEYREELDDAETIAWRKERREYLMQFTEDPEILKKVDYVAFSQGDLEDIMSDEQTPPVVYLCGKFFRFPSGIFRKSYVTYIGMIDDVKVKFETTKKINPKALGITLENITVTTEEPVEEEEVVEEVEEIEEVEEEEEEIEEEVIPFSRNIENKILKASFIPASAITQTALRFRSRISLRYDGKTIDAKSIEMAKSRGLVMGQKVRVLTEGEDADQAMEAFTQLFEFGPKKKRVQ